MRLLFQNRGPILQLIYQAMKMKFRPRPKKPVSTTIAPVAPASCLTAAAAPAKPISPTDQMRGYCHPECGVTAADNEGSEVL